MAVLEIAPTPYRAMRLQPVLSSIEFVRTISLFPMFLQMLGDANMVQCCGEFFEYRTGGSFLSSRDREQRHVVAVRAVRAFRVRALSSLENDFDLLLKIDYRCLLRSLMQLQFQ